MSEYFDFKRDGDEIRELVDNLAYAAHHTYLQLQSVQEENIKLVAKIAEQNKRINDYEWGEDAHNGNIQRMH